MLTNIGLSPFAVEELSTFNPPSVVRIAHRVLRETLSAHGVVHLANLSEMDKLISLIRSDSPLAAKESVAWRETLLSLKLQGRIHVGQTEAQLGISEVSDALELERLVRSHPDWPVCVMTEIQLEKVFPDESDVARTQSARCVSGASIREAEPISALESAAALGRLSHGESREGFWQAVLEPLAAPAKTITILDRYVLKGMQNKAWNLPRSRSWDDDVLTWLFNRVDSMPGGDVEIDICAGVGQPGLPATAQDALKLVEASWTPRREGRIRAINLYVGGWEHQHGWLPHDRHVRFGHVQVLAVPSGLDRLGRRLVQDSDGMKWEYKWQAAQARSFHDAEDRVRKAHPRFRYTVN